MSEYETRDTDGTVFCQHYPTQSIVEVPSALEELFREVFPSATTQSRVDAPVKKWMLTYYHREDVIRWVADQNYKPVSPSSEGERSTKAQPLEAPEETDFSVANPPSGFVIHERGTKLGIQLPFKIKNNFRENFPSAKWDPSTKEWLVGKASRQRLDSWLSVASSIAEELAVDEEMTLTLKQAWAARQQFEDLQRSLQSMQRSRQMYDDAIGTLEKFKGQLEGLLEDVNTRLTSHIAKMNKEEPTDAN